MIGNGDISKNKDHYIISDLFCCSKDDNITVNGTSGYAEGENRYFPYFDEINIKYNGQY